MVCVFGTDDSKFQVGSFVQHIRTSLSICVIYTEVGDFVKVCDGLGPVNGKKVEVVAGLAIWGIA